MTLLVLVVFATAIAAVPAFAATTSQVSITGLAGALSASDEVPPPRMFTEPWMFGLGVEVFPSDGMDYWFNKDLAPDVTLPNVWELRGRGPHGGYTTTSAKCAVCHSAHNASAGEYAFDRGGEITAAPGPNVMQPRGYALLRAGSTGCEYCHLTGSPIGDAGMWGRSSRIVYTSGAEVAGESNLNPDSGHTIGFDRMIPRSINPDCLDNGSCNCTGDCGLSMADRPLTCSTCHAVHGNFGTWQPLEFYRGEVYDSITQALYPNLLEKGEFEDAGAHENNETVRTLGYRMLRLNPSPLQAGDPAEVGVDGEYPDCFATSQDQINQFTMNEWCSSCHNDPNMLVPMEYTLRSIGADTTWTFEDFEAFYLSRMTAFTLNNTDVHSDETFAHDYDDPTEEASAPHVTSFEGIFSGPGQCYTCHRGDLGGPLGEEWRWTAFDGTPVDDPLDVPLTGDESLARLRALGYFRLLDDALMALLTSNQAAEVEEAMQELQERQARNLSCSGCHGFGTADYAFWSPRSDWPHSSPSTDRMLLGMELDDTDLAAFGDTATPEERTEVIAQNFCGRCHWSIPDESDPDQPSGNFLISRHFRDHMANVGNSGNMGTLGTLSPGNPQNNPPAP